MVLLSLGLWFSPLSVMKLREEEGTEKSLAIPEPM
jgi:hypothetical protein